MCSPRGIAALALAGSALLAAAPASAATRVTPLTPSKKVISPPTRIVGKTVTGLKPKISTKISAPVISGQLPAAVNLTNHAMPVGDQGNEGSCEAWTVEYGLLGWYANKFNRSKPILQRGTKRTIGVDWFHPMMGFRQYGVPETGKYKANDPYKGFQIKNGAWAEDGFEQIEEYGAPPSTEYKGALGTWDYFHTPTLLEYASASAYRVKPGLMKILFLDYGTPGTQNDLNAIKKQLASGRPVMLAIGAGTDFSKLGTGVLGGDKGATGDANHAILALGYDSEGLLLQNSWGTDWGNKGYGKVSWAWALKGVFGAIVLNTSADPFLKPKGS